MRDRYVVLALSAFCVLGSAPSTVRTHGLSAARLAQADASITPLSVLGEIIEINPGAKTIIVRTAAGNTVAVSVNENTIFMRIPPGEKDKSKYLKITISDFAVGDRVFARGRVAEDRKSVPALEFYVMSKAEITAKQDRAREEWSRRGTAGVISALNPTAKEVTLTARTSEGPKPIIIPIGENVKLRRYAPDSVKFSDAKPSSFDELKVGDQLRALGERSADGTRFIPEEIVTGSFRTIGGIVRAVDPQTTEIKIEDVQTRQPLTVVINKDSLMRRLTPEVAALLAPPQSKAETTRGSGALAPSAAAQNSGAPSGDSRVREKGAVDFQETFERLPELTVAELKPGDMLLVSSTVGADPSRVTAIALLAGADAILKGVQRGGQRLGGGSLDFGIGAP